MNENLEVATLTQFTNKAAKKAKIKPAKDDAVYYMGAESSDGTITLSAPMSEEDIVRAAYKRSVCFYRVQKMKADCGPSTGMKIVAVPAK